MEKVRKIIIYSNEIHPETGGVGHYTFHLAHQVMKLQKLLYLCSFLDPPKHISIPFLKLDWPVVFTGAKADANWFIRKWTAVNYYLRLYSKIFISTLQLPSNPVLVTSCYMHYDHFFLKSLMILRRQFLLVYHGLDIIWLLNNNKTLFHSITRKASQLITNSNETRKLLGQHVPNLDLSTVNIIYPKLKISDLSNVQPLNNKQLSSLLKVDLSGKVIISSVGHLVKRKGFDIAVEMVLRLIKIFPNLHYLMVGEGNEEQTIRNMIDEQAADTYITMTGRVSDQIKYSILYHSQVFMMPNHSIGGQDIEGFGISFLEAAYFKNLVISGSHGGAKEAVINGVTGFNFDFPSTSAKNKCQALVSDYLSDNERLQVFTSDASDYVKTHFNWDNTDSITW